MTAELTTTQEPGTQEPGTQEPGTQETGTQETGTQETGTQVPGTQEPGAQVPGGHAAAVEELVAAVDAAVDAEEIEAEIEAAPPRALVVTVSNRASAGVYADRGGPILVDGLKELGFTVDGPQVVRDGEPVADALIAAVAAGYDVVLTTGGTGLTPLDLTPEMTSRVITREVPGIAEAIRMRSMDKVPASVLSRGLAGLAGRTLVVNLPGSPGGCKDGMAVLGPVLRHAVDQIGGGDH